MGALFMKRAVLFIFLLLFSGCVQEEKAQNLQLGDPAPDFAVKDLAGRVTVLSNFAGSPVILRFFETGCRFCKADTPAFSRFYDKYKGKDLQLLYIGSFYESEEALRTFIDELHIDFPVAMDEGARLADLYGVRVYPQTLFISPDQKIVAAILGGVGEAELEEILGKYL